MSFQRTPLGNFHQLPVCKAFLSKKNSLYWNPHSITNLNFSNDIEKIIEYIKPQFSHVKNLEWSAFFPELTFHSCVINYVSSVQLPSHFQLCNPMDCSMPGLPVYHQLLELAHTHVHWIDDAIQLSHPLSSPSPLAYNVFQHQGLF